MLEKIYLYLLILCGILCHGIIVALSGEDDRESSDFLVRKRRVISHLPGGISPLVIDNANYNVNMKEDNVHHCSGVILSHYTVLTAATCVILPVSHYQVLSGSGYPHLSNYHNVTLKELNYGNPPHEVNDGIALITVEHPFVYNRKVGQIQLYEGPLLAGTQVTVTGWGCMYPINQIPGIRRVLRSITLPIMNHRDCQYVYGRRFRITEKYICTYDENQHCARTDSGAPLVLNNRLAGIHIYKGEFTDRRNPDVFIDLQRDEYSEWIRRNTLLT